MVADGLGGEAMNAWLWLMLLVLAGAEALIYPWSGTT